MAGLFVGERAAELEELEEELLELGRAGVVGGDERLERLAEVDARLVGCDEATT